MEEATPSIKGKARAFQKAICIQAHAAGVLIAPLLKQLQMKSQSSNSILQQHAAADLPHIFHS